MSVIRQRTMLESAFKLYNVQEVYISSTQKDVTKIVLYAVLKDKNNVWPLTCKLLDCPERDFRVVYVPASDAPILENKKLIWFMGEWRVKL